MAQASFFCPRCQQMKLFVGEEMSHAAHILAAVFLCGLWLPIWLLTALTYKPQYRCSNCGFTDGLNYLANPLLRSQEMDASRVLAKQRAEKKERYLEIAAESEGLQKPFYRFLALEHSTGIIIGAFLFGVFFVFVIINVFRTAPKQTVQSISPTTQSPSNQNYQLNNSTPKFSASQKPIQTPKKSSGLSKTAFVISENVNLRASPDSVSDIIDILPNGTAVIVLRQKGAWFYVSSGTLEGWVHGNTIRLE